mgnify:FL=1
MIRYVLQIDGMQCGMCESHINDAVRREFKVKSVNSSHSKNITEIISPEPLDEVRLENLIHNTGYELRSIVSEPYEKKGFFDRFKK